MDLLQTIVLALIQGVTEFLPISSSAHLILPAQLLAWPDQGIVFDVAVHVGSLAAVVIYFRRDLLAMGFAWFGSLSFKRERYTPDARLAWMVIVATLPAALAGLLARDFIEANLRSTTVIAIATIFFGVLLAIAEYRSRRQVAVVQITWMIAVVVGLAQVFALIPGTSRSGVTITAAVLLGLSKTDGARFSFLLSVPLILASGGYAALSMIDEAPIFSWYLLAIAIAVSAISAYCCIALFLKLIDKIGFMPFVWYRMVLGIILLSLV